LSFSSAIFRALSYIHFAAPTLAWLNRAKKTFEHFTLWVDRRTSTMKRTLDKIIRLAIVLTTMVAWFSISNHCALGALTAARTYSAMAPMHCHGNQPAPSKKSSEEEMPCCKMLRATLAGEAKVVEVASQNFVPIQHWIVAELISAAEPRLPALELGTGPPFAGSFAESVLQQSILAHAPPSLV